MSDKRQNLNMQSLCKFLHGSHFCCSMRQATAVLLAVSTILMWIQYSLFLSATSHLAPRHKYKHAMSCPDEDVPAMWPSKVKWTRGQHNIVLGTYHLAQIAAYLPSGYLADRYGGRWPVFVSLLLSSLVILMSPVALKGWWSSCVLAGVLGLAQGTLYPAATSLLQHWVPPTVRATVGGHVYSAYGVGVALAEMWRPSNWEAVFYLWGCFGLLWTAVSYLYGHSEPSLHPYIRDEELQQSTIPRKRLRMSLGVAGFVCAHFGHKVVLLTTDSNMSRHMHGVTFHLSLATWYNSLPYILMYLGGAVSGLAADHAVHTCKLDLALVRKVLAISSSVGSHLFTLMISYSKCSRPAALTFLGLAMLLKGLFYSSVKVNSMDLTTSHAGFLMAVALFLESSLEFAAVPLLRYLLELLKERHERHALFWTCHVLHTVAMLLFLLFGSGNAGNSEYADEQKPEEKLAERVA